MRRNVCADRSMTHFGLTNSAPGVRRRTPGTCCSSACEWARTRAASSRARPKPITLYKQLLADPTVIVTVSSTIRNAANLPPEFLNDIISRYQGTRLGRQELEAELVDDVEGALWRREWIERSRTSLAPRLDAVIVAVDPAVTANAESHETGIVVAGLDRRGQVYVLADYSMRASPDAWARRAVAAFHEHGADRLSPKAIRAVTSCA